MEADLANYFYSNMLLVYPNKIVSNYPNKISFGTYTIHNNLLPHAGTYRTIYSLDLYRQNW